MAFGIDSGFSAGAPVSRHDFLPRLTISFFDVDAHRSEKLIGSKGERFGEWLITRGVS